MNGSIDRTLADWLREGPESGPREGLERALAATRRVDQRPGWTLPERWLPMRLTLARTPAQRPILALMSLVLLVVALVASALFIGRLQSPSLRNGAVVYSAEGYVNADQVDVFIADQLGGPVRPLVPGPDSDSNPVFSPQGDRVAFIRNGSRIMTISPDGSGIRELASPGRVVRLDWSPDGSALLATTYSPEDLQALTIVQRDGSGYRTLDLAGIYPISGVWRPDGRHIAFVGWRAGDLAVFIADTDDTNVGYLGDGDGPAWSPDGNQLAFLSQDGISIADIAEDGAIAGLHQLALGLDPGSSPATAPKWSPDGSQLAFAVGTANGFRVAIAEADGSGTRLVGQADMVTDSQLRLRRGLDLTWSPDGRSLIIGLEGGAWSLDVVTGEPTAVGTPVESWQRLAP